MIDQPLSSNIQERATGKTKVGQIKIAPSILSCDFSRLGEQVMEVTRAGADYLHVDVMDGHFVPNITVGALVVAAIKPLTNLPLDVHLMIEHPERYIDQFAEAGSDIITVHAEVCPHLHRLIQQIKGKKIKAGVALNPASPLNLIDEILPFIDLVLLMTVNPGFGGQPFIPEMLDKIRRLRQILDQKQLNIELEVDGGITAQIAPKVVEAGARVLVAGTAIFNTSESITEALRKIKSAVG